VSTSADTRREKARALVLEHGWNATAYQILNPGIDLWFSAAGDGVVGFVHYNDTRVVAGAPVCALGRLESVAAEFVDDSHARRQRVCYFGAGDRLDTSYAANPKWSRVLLGAQPAWDPREWSSAIATRSSIRAQFNRAKNKGITVSEWPPEVAQNHPELRRCLLEWLDTKHLPPLHFMVEPETLNDLRDRRVMVAERLRRAVVGFTILSPVPVRGGWLVEQIVRGRDAPNGTAELLIDAAMRAVAESGATYATLGLSPLSERANIAPIHQRLWLRFVLRWVRLHGTRFYNFRGLENFKAKFNPHSWEPVFAIAEGPTFSPRDLYAIAGAFSGGTPLRLIARALARATAQEFSRLFRAGIPSVVAYLRAKWKGRQG
jgi:phosphatidylglycerol lysyltransferase